ncbi:hypothetical protein [Nonomuraea sp. LPB2021202275-12-8]|uniref:hypothetical protein n=1 Tax=Nonomuraea sp. LPB2021202275-12-8 TaxID=3120159 RepID=UPI00300D5DB8
MPATDTRPALDQLDFTTKALADAAWQATRDTAEVADAAAWAATVNVRHHLDTNGFYAVREAIAEATLGNVEDLQQVDRVSVCAILAGQAATTVASAHARLDHSTEVCADCGFHATERIIRDGEQWVWVCAQHLH